MRLYPFSGSPERKEQFCVIVDFPKKAFLYVSEYVTDVFCGLPIDTVSEHHLPSGTTLISGLSINLVNLNMVAARWFLRRGWLWTPLSAQGSAQGLGHFSPFPASFPPTDLLVCRPSCRLVGVGLYPEEKVQGPQPSGESCAGRTLAVQTLPIFPQAYFLLRHYFI